MLYGTFRTGTIDNNKLYTVDCETELLLQYELDTFSYQILTKLTHEKIEDFSRIISIVKVDEILYMASADYDAIISFNLHTNVLQLHGADVSKKNGDGIKNLVTFKKKIWIFPVNPYKNIRVFDVVSHSFVEIDSFANYMRKEQLIIREDAGLLYVSNDRGRMFFAVRGTPNMIQFDTYTKRLKVYEVKKNSKISNVTFDGVYYWITFVDNTMLVRWEPQRGCIEQREINEIEVDERKIPIYSAFERNNYVYIMPTYKDSIFIYNQTELKEEIKKVFERSRELWHTASYISIFFYGQYILFLPMCADKIIRIDSNNGEILAIESVIKKEDWRKYVLNKEYIKTAKLENDYFRLRDYINFL